MLKHPDLNEKTMCRELKVRFPNSQPVSHSRQSYTSELSPSNQMTAQRGSFYRKRSQEFMFSLLFTPNKSLEDGSNRRVWDMKA